MTRRLEVDRFNSGNTARTALDLSRFLDEIVKICRQAGFEVSDDRRVYCVGVKLEDSIAVAVQ